MTGKAWAVAIAAALVAAAGTVFLIQWLTPDPLANVPLVVQSLEENWDKTIRRYGIEPIFPPEEDLTVGDVLAVVVADNEQDPELQDKNVEKSPFLKRSVKLAHIDVRTELAEAYALLPVFPAPAAAPVGGPQGADIPGAAAAASVGRHFKGEVPQGNLPRAAFPSLKIQGVNTAGAGFTAGGRGSANYLASTQGLEELHLTEVRTYGLPSVLALELLTSYCEAPKTKRYCEEATARKHLERIVGNRIHSKYVSDMQGNTKYAMTVEIIVVNRVYLTRSILHLRRTGSARGGGMFGQSGGGTVNQSPEPTPTPASGTAGERAEYEAMKRRLADAEKQLAQARAGGTIVYESSSGNETMMEEKFDRPVAIGYRGVRYDFPQNASAK